MRLFLRVCSRHYIGARGLIIGLGGFGRFGLIIGLGGFGRFRLIIGLGGFGRFGLIGLDQLAPIGRRVAVAGL